MDVQSVSLLVPLWILMVSILELVGLQGQNVSSVYTGTKLVGSGKVYLETKLLTCKL